jgi:predicted HNH restriction endonuclease
MATKKVTPDNARLDRVIAQAKRNQAAREKGYREQALKLYPWICGRCGREFTHTTVQLLEVHHRDHNHDNNPPDGSNWELLCTYCHEAEHRRYLDSDGRSGEDPDAQRATYKAFADLDALLKQKDKK